MHHTAFEPLLRALTVEMLKSGGKGTLHLGIIKTTIYEHEDGILAAARTEIDEEWHRWFLWESCTHDGKYGDDGQMQCQGVDFKRDPMWQLQQHVEHAIGEKNADLISLRALTMELGIKLATSEEDNASASKRIEVLEDLLHNIYRGPVGMAFPRDIDIIRIAKELDI